MDVDDDRFVGSCRRCFFYFFLALFLTNSFSINLYAQIQKAKVLKVKKTDLLFTRDYEGKQIQCLKRKNKFFYGVSKKSGKKFKVAKVNQRKIFKLKTKIASGNFSSKKVKSIRKKIKRIKKEFKAKKKLCKGNNSQADHLSMDPLERAITDADLIYLVEKAGFGYSAIELDVILKGRTEGLEAAVDEFMRIKPEPAGLDFRYLDWRDELLNNNDDVLRGGDRNMTFRGIRRAWLDRIIHTHNAYRERFAIFLLGLWTVNDSVLSSSQTHLMFDYIEKLRVNAGNANAINLAISITRDPHMLIFLDGQLNIAQNPNENFARELLELFTVGPINLAGQANYTENGDIVEISKALTGWVVDYDELVPGSGDKRWFSVFRLVNHAPGGKILFKGTNYEIIVESDEDVIRAIFANHPNVAVYYAKEILKEYLNAEPEDQLVLNFADRIRFRNFNLTLAMKDLLMSKAFYSEVHKDTVVKNPQRTSSWFY